MSFECPYCKNSFNSMDDKLSHLPYCDDKNEDRPAVTWRNKNRSALYRSYVKEFGTSEGRK